MQVLTFCVVQEGLFGAFLKIIIYRCSSVKYYIIHIKPSIRQNES